MEILLYLLLFIAGLAFGSFLNLVSDRVIRGESILWGRSHCDKCKTSLVGKDLIPLLSFAFLKARCRYCKEKLSFIYPGVELATGLLFVGAAFFTNILKMDFAVAWTRFAFLLIIICFYIVLFLTDMKYRLIPNKVIFGAISFVTVYLVGSTIFDLASLHYRLANDAFGKYLLKVGFWNDQLNYDLKNLGLTLLGAIIIGLFFAFLIWITKGRGMGGGDVTLGVLIGLVNGFPKAFLAIFVGFFLGSIYSLILVVLRKKSVKDTIPFGPFLILGSAVVYIWGDLLLKWYFGLF